VRVEVRAFATLAAYLPPRPRDAAAFLELPEGGTVGDLAKALRIPDGLAMIALVNGLDADLERPLRPGDVVTLFPPLVGGGGTPAA
jgi:molybdopterin converting factor small subunit